MKKKNVDFSILVPTFNRSNYIQYSIYSALRQQNVTFEIIVCDDHSTDDTEQVVKSFKDKRIRYTKNKRRIGISMNFQRCFLLSVGKYIFTLGDDDILLDDHTLFEVLQVMKKHKLGMGKIGTITYETSITQPYQIFNLSEKLILLKPSTIENILASSVDFGLGFFSGLIFDNTRMDRKKLQMNHECYVTHMCHTYNPVAFDLIQKYGIAYIPRHFILSHLSLQLIPKYFDMRLHGRLYMEEPINQVKQLLKGAKFEQFKQTYIRNHLIMLPNIKYFTNNDNYIHILKRMIYLDKTLLTDKQFIFWALIGFIPKFVIKMLREAKIAYTKNNVIRILQRYEYDNKIRDLQTYIDKTKKQ